MLSRVKSKKALKLIGFKSTMIKCNFKALTEMERMRFNSILTAPSESFVNLTYLNIRLCRSKTFLSKYLNNYVKIVCLVESKFKLGFCNFTNVVYLPTDHGLSILSKNQITVLQKFFSPIEAIICIIEKLTAICKIKALTL